MQFWAKNQNYQNALLMHQKIIKLSRFSNMYEGFTVQIWCSQKRTGWISPTDWEQLSTNLLIFETENTKNMDLMIFPKEKYLELIENKSQQINFIQ